MANLIHFGYVYLRFGSVYQSSLARFSSALIVSYILQLPTLETTSTA